MDINLGTLRSPNSSGVLMSYGPSVAELAGGIEMGVLISAALYGITVVQACTYACNCKDDPKYLKCMVAAVILLESSQAIVGVELIYQMLIGSFDDPAQLAAIPRTTGICPLLENIMVAIVQGFYIHRIWILGQRRNLWLVIVTSVLLSTRFGLSLVATSYLLRFRLWSEFHTNGPNIIVHSSNGLLAFVDAIVAIATIYYLRQGAGFNPSTDGVARWILMYVVNSGAITFVAATAVMVTYSVMPESLLFSGILLIMSRFYANSFLGTLNARSMLRTRLNTTVPSFGTYKLSMISKRTTYNSARVASMKPPPLSYNYNNATRSDETTRSEEAAY
ncbi:hypothetical protein K474DRAFT_1222836 [Panus rudis PR-1116 ss-1]|nr:hypothetical protein K474DRAFT_1222836 [Panus rudis PR-1116 ss-1]